MWGAKILTQEATVPQLTYTTKSGEVVETRKVTFASAVHHFV
jgi:hypothetical protein